MDVIDFAQEKKLNIMDNLTEIGECDD